MQNITRRSVKRRTVGRTCRQKPHQIRTTLYSKFSVNSVGSVADLFFCLTASVRGLPPRTPAQGQQMYKCNNFFQSSKSPDERVICLHHACSKPQRDTYLHHGRTKGLLAVAITDIVKLTTNTYNGAILAQSHTDDVDVKLPVNRCGSSSMPAHTCP